MSQFPNYLNQPTQAIQPTYPNYSFQPNQMQTPYIDRYAQNQQMMAGTQMSLPNQQTILT